MKSFLCFLLVLITGATRSYAEESRFTISSNIGVYDRYFGFLFGCTSQDDPALQGSVTITDKKTGIYFSEWQSRHLANVNTRNFNWENDHVVGQIRQLNKNVSLDLSITYFDLITESTDWWMGYMTLSYTKSEWRPFVKLAYLVPTNNNVTNGGICGKVGVEREVLKGLTLTTSIGGHGSIMGYGSKLSFVQLIANQNISISKNAFVSVTALTQKKITGGADYVEDRLSPTWGISVTNQF